VHPTARRRLVRGEHIVDARLREEREAKKVLADLEKLDVDSIAFDTKIRLLKNSVIAHAPADEAQEFEPLGAVLEPERLAKMRRAAEVAEAIAPTRPHPGIESASANILVGPFASMLDRARDAISGKNKH
jgi:hypothetical protein